MRKKIITVLGDIGILVAFISVFVQNQGASYWVVLRACGFLLALIRIFYDLYKEYK